MPPCWTVLPGLTRERLAAFSPPISSSPTHHLSSRPVTKSQPSSLVIWRHNASFQSIRTTWFFLPRNRGDIMPHRPLTKQVGPDVAGLCMDAEDALEASPEGGHGWPVAVQQVVVVLQPVREHIVRDDPPASLPDLEELTLQQCGFEMHRSTYTWVFQLCRGLASLTPHRSRVNCTHALSAGP